MKDMNYLSSFQANMFKNIIQQPYYGSSYRGRLQQSAKGKLVDLSYLCLELSFLKYLEDFIKILINVAKDN